jgi:probable rRNA maturation factor
MNIERTLITIDDSNFHIEFYFDDVDRNRLSADDLALLRRAVITALDHEQVRSAEVSVAVVSAARMQQLNQQYLQHDYDTDVLSFCLETEEDLGFLLGQLIVSIDYATQQCESLGRLHGSEILLAHELALYLVHGSLHLVGYDDHTPDERAEMRCLELQILRPLGITPVWVTLEDDTSSPSMVPAESSAPLLGERQS